MNENSVGGKSKTTLCGQHTQRDHSTKRYVLDTGLAHSCCCEAFPDELYSLFRRTAPVADCIDSCWCSERLGAAAATATASDIVVVVVTAAAAGGLTSRCVLLDIGQVLYVAFVYIQIRYRGKQNNKIV